MNTELQLMHLNNKKYFMENADYLGKVLSHPEYQHRGKLRKLRVDKVNDKGQIVAHEVGDVPEPDGHYARIFLFPKGLDALGSGLRIIEDIPAQIAKVEAAMEFIPEGEAIPFDVGINGIEIDDGIVEEWF